MNRQKLHLNVASTTIMLALAVLCYGGQTGGRHVAAAESHDRKLICSHNDKSDAGPSRVARPKVTVRGDAAVSTLRMDGGQIG
jgi:hypothetical protein